MSTTTTTTTTTMPPLLPPSRSLILVVDPYSTGCLVAMEIAKRGHPIVAIWTKGFNPEMKTHVPPPAKDLVYLAEIDDVEPWDLDDLISAVRDVASGIATSAGRPPDHYVVSGCIAGGEAGVDMADALSERLGVLSNGTEGEYANRRDKRVQQDLVRAAGMRAVRQACGSTFGEVEGFLMSESFPVVSVLIVVAWTRRRMILSSFGDSPLAYLRNHRLAIRCSFLLVFFCGIETIPQIAFTPPPPSPGSLLASFLQKSHRT